MCSLRQAPVQRHTLPCFPTSFLRHSTESATRRTPKFVLFFLRASSPLGIVLIVKALSYVSSGFNLGYAFRRSISSMISYHDSNFTPWMALTLRCAHSHHHPLIALATASYQLSANFLLPVSFGCTPSPVIVAVLKPVHTSTTVIGL